MSRWRIGGRADLIVRPGDLDQLAAVISLLHREGIAYVVIGSTSNLLFADEGLRAVCIQIGPRMSKLQVCGQSVIAEAGIWVPGFARRVMKAGLTGAEHISGIPGTIGGLICMNGGSQRKGIGDSLVSVMSVTRQGEFVQRDRTSCKFAYRQSVFQENGEVIAQAEFTFDPTSDHGAVRREMLAILASRRQKFPQKQPNCGSVFVSDPAMYSLYGSPGAIIERLGLKGRRIGNAEISTRHANFIVNRGGAQARDVLSIIRMVQETVFRTTGFLMRTEVRYVDPRGTEMKAEDALNDMRC
jgi:UDP-N-acetylmuramate dehydrogenase